MPIENPDTTPNEPTEDWQQLAHDAREHWNLEHPGVAAFYENHVVPKLLSKGLGHLAITNDERAGGRFLRKYGAVDPREEDHVIGYLRGSGQTIPEKAGDRTAAYLKFMADTVNDGILTGDPASVNRQIDAHVIKPEDVPESYFAFQRRIAREQGHGDIEITPDMRRQLIEAAQADQRGSLEKWVEYLGGDDGSYPDWFKRYAWDSVTKLGAYDKEKAKFGRRDATTVAPYPELNREALAYTYDTVKKFHVLGEKIDDNKLTQILKEGSFGRLYAHAITEVTPDNPELLNSVEGSWTLFNQTHDPRTARRLSGSLQGHGTGWCTAGESTAAAQLSAGDFYVYYTRDEDGRDTVPRVAVRMQSGEVAEVRGVLPNQNMEPIMADIVNDKLRTLPGGEQYVRRAEDMKRLTDLENTLKNNPDMVLSSADLAFLYELHRDIDGFGYERDPRIDEIKARRGERDYPEITRLLPEILAEQAESSYKGYGEVAWQLGVEVASEQEFRELLDAKMEEWRENGVMRYIVRDFVDNGNKPNLLATPNIVTGWDDLRSAAVNFGKNQPYETFVFEELYSHYSAEELSGVPTKGSVRFGVMPSGYTRSLGQAPVDTQHERLEQIQAEQPSLGMRVPSVLEAITYWYALRAKDGSVADFDKTYIRHFNLRPVRIGSWPGVPSSYVYGDGEPGLYFSNAGFGDGARVLVG